MTRRNKIVFCLAAVLIGALFMSLTFFVLTMSSAEHAENLIEIFLISFLISLWGWPAMAISAFFGLQLAVRFRWRQVWAWLLAGALLPLAIILLFGLFASLLERRVNIWLGQIIWPLLAISEFAKPTALWIPIFPGAMTALVLRTLFLRCEPSLPSDSQPPVVSA